MISFRDGPARGNTLTLLHAPHYLRVVTAEGKWDALDHVADTPKAEEAIYAYRLCTKIQYVHVDGMIAGRKFGGTAPMACYELCPEQPSDEEMRDRKKWVQWCQGKPCLIRL